MPYVDSIFKLPPLVYLRNNRLTLIAVFSIIVLAAFVPAIISSGGNSGSPIEYMPTGEAIGSTYAFSGEGIGKAMETGILAAESVLGEATDAAVRERYEAGLSALKPKYALYEKANRINAYPWVVDLVIWRARRSQGLVRRLAGILDESRLPDRLFSWRGIKRIILG